MNYDKLIDYLFLEGYIRAKQPVKPIKPTHGSCCTCQTCGFFHDICVCETNRLLADLERLEKDES